jgi:AraC-like DNA-binding protein/quercetin dioxygenase-like cupin family protein
MADSRGRALHQRFLPPGEAQAFVWKYSDSLGGRRPRHFHEEPEINLVVCGSATFGVGERTVRVGEGELVVFPAGQDHVLLKSSPDLYLYAIGLEPGFSAQVLSGELPLPAHVQLDPKELSSVVTKASAIVDKPRCEQLGAELWQRVHWHCRRAAPASGPSTHVLTRRVLELLGKSPELGLDAMARELRAHPTEVSRHFHRDMGMTLVRYRTRRRLLRLVELVDSGRAHLSDAATSAGFGSYSQCHRAFRAELGCAPRDFFHSDVRAHMQLAYAG